MTPDRLRAELSRFDPALPIERAWTPPASWYVRPYFQLDIVPDCGFLSRFTRIFLIHVSQLSILLRDLPYLPASSPSWL